MLGLRLHHRQSRERGLEGKEVNDNPFIAPGSAEDSKSRMARIGSIGGKSRSKAKIAASKANLASISLTTEQRSENGRKGRLSHEQYQLNAFRAWARRRDKQVKVL